MFKLTVIALQWFYVVRYLFFKNKTEYVFDYKIKDLDVKLGFCVFKIIYIAFCVHISCFGKYTKNLKATIFPKCSFILKTKGEVE